MKEFFKNISNIGLEVAEFFHWPNAKSVERPTRDVLVAYKGGEGEDVPLEETQIVQ